MAGIWEVATELELELSDHAEKLYDLVTLIGELVKLAPDDL